jgi:F-type H+-transporting ATPase subunit b
MADLSTLVMLAAAAGAAAPAAHEAAEPMLFGILGPGFLVAASMATLIVIALVAKVPATIASGLDSGITEIRKQLEEARSLRAEAEALRQEYAGRIANAEREAAEMIAHARHEADAIVAKAAADTTEVIARREKMASDKIEAAERGAIADLRNKAAEAATAAARHLIAARHDAGADKALVDQAIAGI